METTLRNVIRQENQAHNEEIKTIIENIIKEKVKNSNSLSEECKDARERSCLTFIFGSKKKELSDNKKPKDKNIKNKNLKKDFFSVYDSKIQEQAPLNTKTNFKINSDEFNKPLEPNFLVVSMIQTSKKAMVLLYEQNLRNLGNKRKFILKK